MTTILSNIRFKPLQKSQVAYNPPKTAKLQEADPSVGGASGDSDYEAKLVKVGKAAPKFNLPGLNGKLQSIEDLVAGKKALLVNFWFYG